MSSFLTFFLLSVCILFVWISIYLPACLKFNIFACLWFLIYLPAYLIFNIFVCLIVNLLIFLVVYCFVPMDILSLLLKGEELYQTSKWTGISECVQWKSVNWWQMFCSNYSWIDNRRWSGLTILQAVKLSDIMRIL